MQNKYPLSILVRGLLVAPIPILVGLFLYAIITEPSLTNNYESNSYLKFLTTMIFAAYMIYIIFISPILLLTLYLINRYNFINIFTLILMTYTYTVLFFALGNYLKEGDLPNNLDELKALFIFNPFLIITLSTAFTFWCFIKSSKKL